jgi:LysM repeat protein
MLYFVQRNDTLGKIAVRFGTTVQAILNANIICNPTLIFIGQPLIIPERNLELPKVGAGPYYVVQPGDTLYCVSTQTGISLRTLMDINNIQNPNMLYAGTELILTPPTTNDPEQLKLTWERNPDKSCMVYGFSEHGVYYNGSFEWAAFGGNAIDYLLELLKNHCDIVRRYAVISLGRLALNGMVRKTLMPLLQDVTIADLVRLAMRRIDLGAMGLQRIHVTLTENRLLSSPNISSSGTSLPEGSEIVVLRWFMPSPTAEEGPRGGIQVYDYVQIVSTGQVGFLPRVGYTEIAFI